LQQILQLFSQYSIPFRLGDYSLHRPKELLRHSLLSTTATTTAAAAAAAAAAAGRGIGL
jgi:hypothetical protein